MDSIELPSTLYEEMQKSTKEWLIFDIGAGVVAGLSMKPSVLPMKPSVLPIAYTNFIEEFLFDRRVGAESWEARDLNLCSIYLLYSLLHTGHSFDRGFSVFMTPDSRLKTTRNSLQPVKFLLRATVVFSATIIPIIILPSFMKPYGLQIRIM